MISIIIPHYNSQELLRRLLDSIDYSIDTEVIVVDDKSNQDIEEFQDLKNSEKYNNVKFLDNKTSVKSAGACRNIGLKHASSKWVLFADADDRFVEGYSKILQRYLDSQYDVVFLTPTSIDLETNEKSYRHYNSKKIIAKYLDIQDEASTLLLKYKIPEPWAKLIRREFLEKHAIRFDETIAANDRMFSTRVGYYMKKFAATKDIAYCVSFCKGSLTNNLSKKVFETRMSVYINYYHFLKERLTRRQFKQLDISGRKFIFKSIVYRYGFGYTLKVIKSLLKNRIRFLSWNMFNPYRIIRYSLKSFRRFVTHGDYYIKDK